MALRLNGSNTGYVELDVPADAGSHTLTLPDGGGSSGQYLQTNGSGGLSWQTVAPAAFESYAVICDQKTQNTDGGAGTTGSWIRRDLNTEISDADGIVSISSNQFTLAAGSYLIKCSAPSYRADYHQIRLYDSTGSAVVQTGTSEFSYNSGDPVPQTRSFLFARVTPSASNIYEIQHRITTQYSS